MADTGGPISIKVNLSGSKSILCCRLHHCFILISQKNKSRSCNIRHHHNATAESLLLTQCTHVSNAEISDDKRQQNTRSFTRMGFFMDQSAEP